MVAAMEDGWLLLLRRVGTVFKRPRRAFRFSGGCIFFQEGWKGTWRVSRVYGGDGGGGWRWLWCGGDGGVVMVVAVV